MGDGKGRPNRHTKQEVREQPRTEQMVRESEEWLFTTLQSIGDAVIATDAEGRIVFMNPVAVQLTGWEEADALGRECREVFRIVNEETRLETESPVAKVIRDGIVSGLANHTILIARDGTERSIDDSGSPIRNRGGALTGVVLIFRDVSDKRAAERTVREQRDILQALFDHLPLLVAFFDADGRLKWTNREWERIMGRSLAGLPEPGMTAEFAGLDAAPVQITRSEEIAPLTMPGWQDVEVQGRDGTRMDVSWASVPLSDGTSIGIGQIVTERRKAEQALGARASVLEAMNDRMKQAMIETHHRVKNNLQALSSLIDLLLIANTDVVPVKELTQLRLHIRSLASIHDLLTRDTREEPYTSRLSTKDTLEELVPMLQATVGAERIEFHVENMVLPIRHGMALAVLVNELVTNAVKHGSKRVGLSLALVEDRVALEVCDDGPGFPAQFDLSTTANAGLRLVESMSRWDLGGETAYLNRPDGGACVQIRFPYPRSLEASAH